MVTLEEQFRLLFEAAPNGMIVTDHDGVITFVNKQTEKLFGYSREELFGRSVDVLVPEQFQRCASELEGSVCEAAGNEGDGGGTRSLWTAQEEQDRVSGRNRT